MRDKPHYPIGCDCLECTAERVRVRHQVRRMREQGPTIIFLNIEAWHAAVDRQGPVPA